MEEYRINLGTKNEYVEYEDFGGGYSFDVLLIRGVWHVYVPAGRRALSAAEESRILPRVGAYLSRIWWFGMFPRSYKVEFVREEDSGAGKSA